MFDRFNVWVGSLIARTQDLSLKKDDGQTFVEYALVLVVVVVGVMMAIAWTNLDTAVETAIQKVATAINAA